MTSSQTHFPDPEGLPPWADPSQTHRNNFDFIRLVLAVLVVLSHSYPLVSTSNPEPLSRLIPGYTLGGLAVDGFFILSGYLITQSWLAKPQLGAFLLKRVCRIYPGFVAMMLVLALFVVPFIHEGPRAMWRGLRIQEWITTTLTLGTYIRPDALSTLPQRSVLNGSVWTVRFEGLCYLVLALGMLFGLFRRRWLTLGVFLAGTALWWHEWQVDWRGQRIPATPIFRALIATGLDLRWDGIIDLRNSPLGFIGGTRFLVLFLAGTIFFQFRRHIPSRWYLALACLAAWIFLARHWHRPGVAFIGAAVFLPYVFLYLGYFPTNRLSRFARHGDFSYGAYLYAWPIQMVLISAWRDLQPLALFAVAAPLSVASGYLSWHGVEKHFLRRRHAPQGDAAGLPTQVAKALEPAAKQAGTSVA